MPYPLPSPVYNAAGQTPGSLIDATLINGHSGALGNATAGIFNVFENGAVGDGVTDDSSKLTTTDSSNGGTGVTYFPPTASGYAIKASIALSNAVKLPPGARFKPDSGKTIAINGTLDARPRQIFDLSAGGTVSLGAGSVKRVYPEWAGYVPGATSDPSGTNQAALNWAIVNSASSGAPVWLCGRGVTTNVHGTVTGQSGMSMKGHGGFLKIDTGLSARTTLFDCTAATDFKVEDVGFDGACTTFTETDRSLHCINAPNVTHAKFVRVWARNAQNCNFVGYGTDLTLEDCRMEMAGQHNVFASTGGAGMARFKVKGGDYLNAGRSVLGYNIAVQAASANVDTGDDISIGGGVSCDFPTASATAGCNIFVAGNSNGANTTNKLNGLIVSGVRTRRAGNGNSSFTGASIQITHMCPGAVISDFIDSESQFDGLAVGSAGDCPDVSIGPGTVYGCLSASGQGGNGIEIDASRARITSIVSYNNAGHGVYLAGRLPLGVFLAGSGRHLAMGVRSFGNGYNGITIAAAPLTSLVDCATWGNTLSGIAYQSSAAGGFPVQGLRIRGGRSFGNTRYGLDTSAVYQLAVTGATNATPIVVQTAAHGLITGQTVVVASVGGNTAANGTWTITVVDTTHFSLNTSVGNGAYTSGGTATNTSRCESIDVDGLDFVSTDNGTPSPNTLGAWSGSPPNATLPDRLRNCPGYNVGYQAVTGATTASQAHVGGVLAGNATSAAFAVTLPKAALWPILDELLIQKSDSSGNAVTVTPNGSETINGAATKALSSQYQWLRLHTTGSAWVGMSGTG